MKAFLNYSGKGGVGKSTTTYCLYMAMKELGKEVMVLDMDLNTPSMHHLIEGDDLVSNHNFKGLFLDKSTINLFLKTSINKIRSTDPEVLLIDTPPSITDIHLSIIQKLKISAAILISQPSELSKSDVERTVPFFENEGITVLGIVENMVEDNGIEYQYNKLIEVPKSKGLDSKAVFLDNKKQFIELAETILEANLQEVSQENQKRIIFDESIEWETVKSLYHLDYDEYDCEWRIFQTRSGRRTGGIGLPDLKFINLSTWEKLHEAYTDIYDSGNMLIGNNLTDHVKEATYERVERLVKAFEDSETALFMIVKNPNTEIPTICGEIATCTLKIDDKFNGIPTVEYRTERGTIRMFPHEVMPVTERIMNDAIADGYIYVESGKRFIPSLDVALQYAGTFGKLVGMPEDYDSVEKLWVSVGGKLETKVES